MITLAQWITAARHLQAEQNPAVEDCWLDPVLAERVRLASLADLADFHAMLTAAPRSTFRPWGRPPRGRRKDSRWARMVNLCDARRRSLEPAP